MFYWDSFWELSTTRHELGPIPWTAINEYCKTWGVAEEDIDSFYFFIRGLDSTYLTIKSNEIETKRNMNQTKNAKRR